MSTGSPPLGSRRSPASFSVGFALLSVLSVSLLVSVGFFSDDFTYILHQSRQDGLGGALTPSDSFISLLFEQYTHTFFLYFSSLDSTWLSQGLKMFYVVSSVYMCSRFFSLFMTNASAHVTSFLFVFFPTHESTVYWYLGQYLMLTIAFYFYAYYLLEKGRLRWCVAFAFMASFVSYGSPAPALAMAYLSWRKRGLRSAGLLLGPNLVYTMYYVVTSTVMDLGVERLNGGSPVALVRQYVFQVLTFLESTLGPSMWLKLVYSIGEVTVMPLLVTVLVVVLFCRAYSIKALHDGFAIDRDVLAALGLMCLAAFGMFAMAGRYPNMAFSLGNRTNIFGTALLAYALVWAWSKTRYVGVVMVVLLLSVTGISSHWRAWSATQTAAIATLGDALERNPHLDTVFVSGMQYSRLGDLDHIEFLSEDWVVSDIAQLLTDGRVTGRALHSNRQLTEDGRLHDRKYDESYAIPEDLAVFDFREGELRMLARSDLNAYLATLPKFRRHWLQTIENATIQGWIVRLMPSMGYAFAG